MFSVASNRRSLTVAGLAFATLTALSGCATLQPEDSEKWRESQRPVLIERAEARWNALIKGDHEKAYSFTTPDYRLVVSSQQYRGKFGRALEWRLAHVENVSYDSPTVATVSVNVTYRTALPGTSGEVFESRSVNFEKWIYKNREWWYIAN